MSVKEIVNIGNPWHGIILVANASGSWVANIHLFITPTPMCYSYNNNISYTQNLLFNKQNTQDNILDIPLR